jgi:type I restriction enzyme S subunit
MNKYNSYKDSGVEWIGEIPRHWILKGLRFSFKINKGKIPKTLFDKKGDKMLPYLSMDVLRNNPPKEFSNQDDGLFVRKGEIGILWDGSNSGEIISINQDGILSSTVSRLGISDSKLNKEFSYYILKFYEKDFKENTIGMGIPHMDGNHLKFSKIILPPITEQQQIVSFLDTKTLLIDSLIEKTQRKIELLKEKRTSLINEVVTKGLNPNVDMKDSGVEWIGEIPNHWFVIKIKYVTNQVVDGTHFTPTYTDSGVPFLRVTDIQTEKINLDKVKFISQEEHEVLIKRCNPQKGDILLSKNGTIGITKVVDWDWEFSVFVSLCLIKFKPNFNPHLFSYFFESDIVNQQVSDSSKKTSVTNLHLDKIRELKLIQPPVQEQEQIIEYMDGQTQLIDNTISIEEKKIDTLKEYRQSLISEVVTGKIRVCEEDNSLSLNSQTV